MKRILRIRVVIDRYGKTRSPIYADIQAGLFVRPIKLGRRASGWPEDEIEQLIHARISGADDNAIKKLVAKLHEARQEGVTPNVRANLDPTA
jgi:prophage regulatory protein